MGGTNELVIHGLRAHVSNGEVHLHSDGMKFQRNARGFKADIASAAEALNGTDGAVEVPGDTGTSLILGRNGKKTFAALTSDSDATDDIKRWAEGC